jgi:hypothetical protein
MLSDKELMINKINVFLNDRDVIKQSFESYITNSNETLENRWKVFKLAPLELKNHESYIVHFDAEKMVNGGEIIWFDDFYFERYETIKTVRVIELMNEKGYKKNIIDAFKQEILELNLGSFKYDW